MILNQFAEFPNFFLLEIEYTMRGLFIYDHFRTQRDVIHLLSFQAVKFQNYPNPDPSIILQDPLLFTILLLK